MNAEEKTADDMTPVQKIVKAASELAFIHRDFDEEVFAYCKARRPTGEVLWSKVREWDVARDPKGLATSDPVFAIAWADMSPAWRAALDVYAAYQIARVDAVARHFPTSAEPAVRFVAAERKAEDTIFEQHERSGAIDPHRLAAARAVARIMEQSGVTLDDVGTVLTIEAPTEGDETGDPDETEDDADDETFDGDGGTAAGEPGPHPAPSETPVDGDAAPADKSPRRKAP